MKSIGKIKLKKVPKNHVENQDEKPAIKAIINGMERNITDEEEEIDIKDVLTGFFEEA